MDQFKPFRAPMQVRFRDLDAMGHINNSVYHTYTEQARILFFQRCGLASPLNEGGRLPVILARTEIDFILPGEMSDQVSVNCWISTIGTKSFTVQTAIISEERGPLARSSAVLVWYDYATAKSAAVPEPARSLLESLVWSPS